MVLELAEEGGERGGRGLLAHRGVHKLVRVRVGGGRRLAVAVPPKLVDSGERVVRGRLAPGEAAVRDVLQFEAGQVSTSALLEVAEGRPGGAASD